MVFSEESKRELDRGRHCPSAASNGESRCRASSSTRAERSGSSLTRARAKIEIVEAAVAALVAAGRDLRKQGLNAAPVLLDAVRLGLEGLLQHGVVGAQLVGFCSRW